MLTQVAEGVLTRQSGFVQANAIVVLGEAGLLLIDPGIFGQEMDALADDLHELGQPVLAGFSTHPHWDHMLWDERFGAAPRYATARCASTIRERRLTDAEVKARIAGQHPNVSLERFALVTGLPDTTVQIPWDGPHVRIIEHQAHAPGHAALVIGERRVLVAADMLSDFVIPLLDMNAADPVEDYLAALRLLEDVAGDVDVVIPGHGSVGGAEQMRARIEQDRAYVQALRDARVPDDPRLGPEANWLPVHELQVQQLAQKNERHGKPA